MKVSLYIVFGGSKCQRRQNPVARGNFVARGADFVARGAKGDGGDGVRRLSHSKNILRSRMCQRHDDLRSKQLKSAIASRKSLKEI